MKPIAATSMFDESPTLQDVIHRSVTVLGSTGSIGVNTLDVDRPCPQSLWRARLSADGADGAGQCQSS